MKNDREDNIYVCGVALLVAAIILVVILAVEVRYFKMQTHELVRMREDYSNYILGLRRTIAEYQRATRDQEVERLVESAKKKIEADDQTAFFVNRDHDVLLLGEREYARAQGIEEAWYVWRADAQEVVVPRLRKQRMRKARRQLKTTKSSAATVVPARRDLAGVVRECKFTFPIEGNYWISSPFGPRRNKDGTSRFHYGIDIAAPFGTPVRAVGHGVVVEAARVRGFGLTVVISHGKVKTRYAHMSRIEVAVGETVEAKQRIGRVGNSGNTRGRNGVHLHLEVIVYGKRVPPTQFFADVS